MSDVHRLVDARKCLVLVDAGQLHFLSSWGCHLLLVVVLRQRDVLVVLLSHARRHLIKISKIVKARSIHHVGLLSDLQLFPQVLNVERPNIPGPQIVRGDDRNRLVRVLPRHVPSLICLSLVHVVPRHSHRCGSLYLLVVCCILHDTHEVGPFGILIMPRVCALEVL